MDSTGKHNSYKRKRRDVSISLVLRGLLDAPKGNRSSDNGEIHFRRKSRSTHHFAPTPKICKYSEIGMVILLLSHLNIGTTK